jgi:transcriptional regulator with XRE-family HTH domain
MGEFDKQLGERIKSELKKRGIHQNTLASDLFVSQQTMSTWLLGQRRISAENLDLIARRLDVSADTLLGMSRVSFTEKEKTAIKGAFEIAYGYCADELADRESEIKSIFEKCGISAGKEKK